MATRTFRVKEYWVFLGSKILLPIGGLPTPVPMQAMIQCIGAPNESFAIFFLDRARSARGTNPDEWPNRSQATPGGGISAEVFAPATEYSWYLDIVRNEKPVFAVVDLAAPHMNRIYCNEPAGEGEYLPATS